MSVNDKKLSENFYLTEFTFSIEALKNGIDNTPTYSRIDNLEWLCVSCLQPIRDRWGPIFIESGYRSKKLNDHLGGTDNSDHRLGLAADFYPTKAGKREVFLWILKNMFFKQIIDQISEKGTIHISVLPPNVRSVLHLDANGKYHPIKGLS